jgi:hypothetical protein
MTARSTFVSDSDKDVDLGARVRRFGATLAALVALVAAVPSTAAADPPTRITIVAVFDPITFGENSYVNGQLFGNDQPGQLVGLEQSAPPFTDWAPVAQVTADAQGYYSFKLQPSQTMQYRTNSQGIGSERTVQVNVAPRITLKATALGKTTIRFSGTLAPGLPDQRITIQRRSSTGSWTTVTTAQLQGGTTFAGRLRAHKPMLLRALYAGDPAHLPAASKTIRAVPGKPRH